MELRMLVLTLITLHAGLPPCSCLGSWRELDCVQAHPDGEEVQCFNPGCEPVSNHCIVVEVCMPLMELRGLIAIGNCYLAHQVELTQLTHSISGSTQLLVANLSKRLTSSGAVEELHFANLQLLRSVLTSHQRLQTGIASMEEAVVTEEGRINHLSGGITATVEGAESVIGNVTALKDSLAARVFNLLEALAQIKLLNEVTHSNLETIHHNQTEGNLAVFMELLSHLQPRFALISRNKELDIALKAITRQFETSSEQLSRVAQAEMETNYFQFEALAIHQRYLEVYNVTQRRIVSAGCKHRVTTYMIVEVKESLRKLAVLSIATQSTTMNISTLLSEVDSAFLGFQVIEDQLIASEVKRTIVDEHISSLCFQSNLISDYADMLEPLHCPLELSRLDAILSTTEVVAGISSDTSEALDAVTLPVALVHNASLATSSLFFSAKEILNSQRLLQHQSSTLFNRTMGITAALRHTQATTENALQEISSIAVSEEELQASLAILKKSVEVVSATKQAATDRVQVLESSLDGVVGAITEDIPWVTADADILVSSVENILEEQSVFLGEINNITQAVQQSLSELESLLQEATAAVEAAETTVKMAFSFLNSVSSVTYSEVLRSVDAVIVMQLHVAVPASFSNDTLLSSAEVDKVASETTSELRSISVNVNVYCTNCVILHLERVLGDPRERISVTVGSLNRTAYATVVHSAPVGGPVVKSLSAPMTEAGAYRIDLSRTEVNLYLSVWKIGTEQHHSVSTSTGDQLAHLLRSDFLMGASLHIGGAPTGSTTLQGTLLSGVGNFSGCVSDVQVNGIRVSVWGQAHILPCASSSELYSLSTPLLSFNGIKYSHNRASGSLLPLRVSFNTLLPNGLILFARNEEEVTLRSGFIVVRVDSGNQHRTLTSEHTYNVGSSQEIILSLSRSQRRLLLSTNFEEVGKGLQQVPTLAVLNHTEVFIGGLPDNLSIDLGVSGFSGCLWVSGLVGLNTTCTAANQQVPCSYCLQKAVHSASFYGASYAVFPAVSIGAHFDISFSFKTAFREALLMFSGSADQREWLAVVLGGSRLHLVFRSVFGAIELVTTATALSDNQWHTAVFMKARSSVTLMVDGKHAGSFPFGPFFPTSLRESQLYIGGISPESLALIPLGVTHEPYKGCLELVHLSGIPLDFSASLKTQAVAFDACSQKDAGMSDVYCFDGSEFRQFDLGKLEPNFRVGLLVRTVNSTGLILYAFSRKNENKFALQVQDGKPQFHVTSGSIEGTATSDIDVTDGNWHSILVEKIGTVIQLSINGRASMEIINTPEDTINTNTPLYIGGLPETGRTPLPQAVTAQNYIGCLRTHYLQ